LRKGGKAPLTPATQNRKGDKLMLLSTSQQRQRRRDRVLAKLWKHRFIYLLLIPGVLFIIIFNYIPMYGITLAFKKYMASDGILGSPWIGLTNFKKLFAQPDFWRSLRNTVVISLQRIVFEFPVPIILALMLNEINGRLGKRVLQTVYTFPYFLSWIIVYGLIFNLLSDNGFVNYILVSLGGEKTALLTSRSFFRPLLYISSNWKGMGWGAIIFLASITSINQELYESAVLDGASRWKQTWYITLPCIRPTIAIMLILAVGNTMNAGFDQIFVLYNPSVYEVSDILDTYIYRRAFSTGSNFGQSTAITLFKAVINFALLFAANAGAKLMGEEGIY